MLSALLFTLYDLVYNVPKRQIKDIIHASSETTDQVLNVVENGGIEFHVYFDPTTAITGTCYMARRVRKEDDR